MTDGHTSQYMYVYMYVDGFPSMVWRKIESCCRKAILVLLPLNYYIAKMIAWSIHFYSNSDPLSVWRSPVLLICKSKNLRFGYFPTAKTVLQPSTTLLFYGIYSILAQGFGSAWAWIYASHDTNSPWINASSSSAQSIFGNGIVNDNVDSSLRPGKLRSKGKS